MKFIFWTLVWWGIYYIEMALLIYTCGTEYYVNCVWGRTAAVFIWGFLWFFLYNKYVKDEKKGN